MAKRMFVVAPDYIPKQFLEWHRLNTVFQYDLNEAMELRMPSDHATFESVIRHEYPDIVFANPFDAGWLISEQKYQPLAKPVRHADEVIIFCRADREMVHIQDLQKNMRFAAMCNQDVEMLGLRLLEAANLNKTLLRWYSKDYFQAVLRMVRDGEADAGLILADIFEGLHPSMRRNFRVLVKSALDGISHLFLVRGDDVQLQTRLREILLKGKRQIRYYVIFREINYPYGFLTMNEEDGLFLADVLETLKD